ncbi:MAG: hypothetical protein PHW65_04590 [Dehalococcoidales bacterium]|nr:hypothetical protein [Dehalococcoidales bacterium]
MAIDVENLRNSILDCLELCGSEQDYYKINHADTAGLDKLLRDWLIKNEIEVID